MAHDRGATGMIAAGMILLPLLFSALQPFLPPFRWTAPAVAGLTLLGSCALFWDASPAGGWLLPDPLAVHFVILAALAWLVATLAEALTHEPTPPGTAAAWLGCMQLSLLSDNAGLTVLAAGGAALAAVFTLSRPEPGLRLTVLVGTGLALFGTVVLYGAVSPVLGPDWSSLSWSALQRAGTRPDGAALGVAFVLLLLGLGCACAVLPVWAAIRQQDVPPTVTMLAGPLGAIWLVAVLRLRGLLDTDGHAVAPAGLLLALGAAGLVLAIICLWGRGASGRVLPAATLALLATVLFGFGLGGPVATANGLLHLTLGCLALLAAATGSWAAVLGFAALVGLPPLGVFASGFALMGQAAEHGLALAALLIVLLFAVVALGLRHVSRPVPGGAVAQLGWLGMALTLWLGLLMPLSVAAWLQGIAAVAP